MISRAKRWSARVTRHGDALSPEPGVFSSRAVAESLQRSAERSPRRKSSPFRSTMSMLNFCINRMGTKLGGERRSVLERAKAGLRTRFGRNTSARPSSPAQ